MPEDLVYEIDARIFRVVSEDAFHTMPMAVKHESGYRPELDTIAGIDPSAGNSGFGPWGGF
jgi:hypothetical protein